MTTLLERLERVVAEGWVPDTTNWATDAELSEGYLRSWISQAKHDDPNRGMRLSTVTKLAKAAKISVEWLAHGTGEPRSVLSPEEDARRWFVHRVVNEGLGTEAEALAWLAANAPPFTRPVPWNNELFRAYRQHVEGGVPVDRVAEVLAMPVPDRPLAGGQVLFLKHIAKSRPALMADADEFVQAYKAAQGIGSADDVLADMKRMWKSRPRG